MIPKVIKNEDEYGAALARIFQLMDTLDTDTPEGMELELLVTLVQLYEQTFHPVTNPTEIAGTILRAYFENFVCKIKLLGHPFIDHERTLAREGDGYEDFILDLMYLSFLEGCSTMQGLGLKK